MVAAIVELDGGPRLMSFLVAVEADATHIDCGMPINVTLTPDAEDRAVPVFRPIV